MNTGTIYDIKRFAIHDGPGIRTTIFLKGCPCDCWWCHNPESRSQEIVSFEKEVILDDKTISRKEDVGESYTVEALLQEIKKDTVFYQNSKGGVTFSGGEPMQQKSFLIKLLKKCKAEGIHTTLDTTAFFSTDALDEIIDDVDLFMIDIKFWNKTMHQKHVGLDNTIILQNIADLLRSNKKVWIRIPVIPTINTGDMDNILRFLEKHPKPEQVNLLPYHQIGRHKYNKFGIAYRMEGIEPPKEEYMLQLKMKFETQGFETQIGG